MWLGGGSCPLRPIVGSCVAFLCFRWAGVGGQRAGPTSFGPTAVWGQQARVSGVAVSAAGVVALGGGAAAVSIAAVIKNDARIVVQASVNHMVATVALHSALE